MNVENASSRSACRWSESVGSGYALALLVATTACASSSCVSESNADNEVASEAGHVLADDAACSLLCDAAPNESQEPGAPVSDAAVALDAAILWDASAQAVDAGLDA
jgi:hypothetical protein